MAEDRTSGESFEADKTTNYQPGGQPPGPGWWQANDGNWYPPETSPGAASVPESPPSPGWWKASDGNWYPPEPPVADLPPPPESAPSPGWWKANDGNWYPPEGSLPDPPSRVDQPAVDQPAVDYSGARAEVAESSAQRTGGRGKAIALAGVAALLAIWYFAFGSSDDSIERAAEDCSVEGLVRDDGATITFDTKGEDDRFGDSFEEVACVLLMLEAPSRLTSQITGTRALDGTQDGKWEQYAAQWRYHPDNGLGITIWIDEEE